MATRGRHGRRMQGLTSLRLEAAWHSLAWIISSVSSALGGLDSNLRFRRAGRANPSCISRGRRDLRTKTWSRESIGHRQDYRRVVEVHEAIALRASAPCSLGSHPSRTPRGWPGCSSQLAPESRNRPYIYEAWTWSACLDTRTLRVPKRTHGSANLLKQAAGSFGG